MRFFVLSLLTILIPLTAGAVDRSIGTCLTAEGLLVAPWTDAWAPACGSDCGNDSEEIETETCDVSEDCLLPVSTAPVKLPAPRGPLCLDDNPTCSPGGTLPLNFSMAGGAALQIQGVSTPRRIQGTLPGAGPPFSTQTQKEYLPQLKPRPPRA